MGSILALNHKFFNASKSTGETKGSPPLGFFSPLCDFFRKFSKFFKGYPLAFFWSFRFVENIEWAWMDSFWVFRHCATWKILFSKKKFENNFFPNFSNSCSLNIFEPKIWRRLGTFPSCFLFQLTISLWMVHFLQFVHLFCCSSSTKFLKPESGGSILALNHNIFILPKVQQVRPKGPPLGLSALCDFFSKIFEFHQRVPLAFFRSFRFVKSV